jgi:hypothetical protein
VHAVQAVFPLRQTLYGFEQAAQAVALGLWGMHRMQHGLVVGDVLRSM